MGWQYLTFTRQRGSNGASPTDWKIIEYGSTEFVEKDWEGIQPLEDTKGKSPYVGDIDRILKELGEESWELVAITQNSSLVIKGQTFATEETRVFKKTN